MIIVCSLCRRAKMDGQWIDAYTILDPISHSYCPACLVDYATTIWPSLSPEKAKIEAYKILAKLKP